MSKRRCTKDAAITSFCFYLEGTGARLLLLGGGILVVCGHGEPIGVEESEEKKLLNHLPVAH